MGQKADLRQHRTMVTDGFSHSDLNRYQDAASRPPHRDTPQPENIVGIEIAAPPIHIWELKRKASVAALELEETKDDVVAVETERSSAAKQLLSRDTEREESDVAPPPLPYSAAGPSPDNLTHTHIPASYLGQTRVLQPMTNARPFTLQNAAFLFCDFSDLIVAWYIRTQDPDVASTYWKCKSILDLIRQRNDAIVDELDSRYIHIEGITDPKNFATPINHNKYHELYSGLLKAKTSSFSAEFTPLPSEFVARRPRASAFQDTGLYEHLSKKNVKTLYLCGYSIFETIIATHLSASSHDYDIKVLADCILEPFAKYEGIEIAQRFLPRLCDMATAQDIIQLFHTTSQ